MSMLLCAANGMAIGVWIGRWWALAPILALGGAAVAAITLGGAAGSDGALPLLVTLTALAVGGASGGAWLRHWRVARG